MIAFALCTVVFLCVLSYIWKRRWLYYYASKIQGPFAFPLLGSAHLFIKGRDVYFEKIMELCEKYKPISKLWLGSELGIIVTKPKDIKLLTKTFLSKARHYDFFRAGFGDGLLTAPADEWKLHRKAINCSFSENILNSYIDIFAKRAKILADKLKKDFVDIRFDVNPKFFACTLDIILESCLETSLTDSDQQNRYMQWITSAAEIVGFRLFHPLYQSDFVWNLRAVAKELALHIANMFTYARQIVARKKSQYLREYQIETSRPKNFINYLMQLTYEKKMWTEEQLVDETQTFMAAGSDTTAVTTSFFMLMMAMHQKIQDKIYQELLVIFGNDDRDVTLNDLAQMVHLERAIKETMRLFPIGPVLGRSIDKDFVLDKYVLPKGSTLLIPVALIHRDSSIWKNPLEFDPDRFLPEEFEKIPRDAYIPFGLPPRNCIGRRFAMMSMKVILSTILRNFRVVSCQYSSIKEIKLRINIIIGATNGYGITLESRRKKR